MPTNETAWRRRGVASQVPTERIIELWSQGLTCQQVGDAVGLTRQRVSQRLIEAGLSPSARRMQRLADAGSPDAFRLQRIESEAHKAAQRDRACVDLERIAAEFRVTPWTLGRYVARAGGIRPGLLPERKSSDGLAVASRARRACAPLSVQHVASLCSRRASLAR
jgi:transcriptional regulator with XRE-family HTH domain